MKNFLWILSVYFLTILNLSAQPEVYTWGNISGIRLDGELMELNSTLGLVGADWTAIRKTAKERARYFYRREGNTQVTNVSIDDFFYDQSVEELGAGMANVRINYRNEKDTTIIGTFFMLDLPASKYGDATVQFIGPTPGKIMGSIPSSPDEILRGSAKGLKVKGAARDLEININEGTEIIVRKDPSNENSNIEVYFALMTGDLTKGTSEYRSFKISATGVADTDPVVLTLDRNTTGKPFKGFGGNFRLQNPDTDPPVIDYCLENMDVRWGRVEMPWRFWHPEENDDPMTKANNGELHSRVEDAMKMAQRLHNLGMPVILSDWSAPDWAIAGEMSFGPQPGGLRGNPLDNKKMKQIYKPIADYIQYTRDNFGFEFAMFSFNESDLGIYVRQTPEEHAAFIKGLGAYLESRGINTRLLLGDTADANGWPFVEAAINDKITHQYIGAVSFHSWRGFTDENLQKWASAAERMNLPLLVGEGSMDAGAHRYPDIFNETTYAMEEMNLYTRILKICQPESILQWQLTADYSPMTGGGIFGNHDMPLTPTQRFWNFKQIADMPEDLFAMPVEADKKNITCAALGDNERGIYTVHMVNNGASRQATIIGFPAGMEWMKIYVTNKNSKMSQRGPIRVRDGEAIFFAEANSFITLLADGESPF
ncbi:MAG: hypothetical protein KFF73_16055 [Cyclobacteriaceae bacterium]|nr:hypothetical protein [Cyclobacteriaceae bacterium]